MVLPEVRRWLDCRNSSATEWTAGDLLRRKGSTTVSVVLPARDEEATVGEIVRTVRRELVERVPLVDEIVVMDSCSTDGTARVAAAAGAHVASQDDVLPELPPRSGKGEALWKSLAVTSGEVLAFIDADLKDFPASFVSGLLGPLLDDPMVAYVKGFYQRPLVLDQQVAAEGGGRVTELVARPLLNLYWPLLAGFIQPLSGEYAGRRWALEQVPFVSGYGVELGLLIDLLGLVGLDGLAQVDLGRRVHAHQSTEALGRMSGQIMLAAWARMQREGRASGDPTATDLTQFHRVDGRHEANEVDVSIDERPPMITVPEYAQAERVRTAVTGSPSDACPSAGPFRFS